MDSMPHNWTPTVNGYECRNCREFRWAYDNHIPMNLMCKCLREDVASQHDQRAYPGGPITEITLDEQS